jgi:hypothetical protein
MPLRRVAQAAAMNSPDFAAVIVATVFHYDLPGSTTSSNQ